MTVKEELELIVKAADDKRAEEEIVVLDMEGILAIADYFVICHGNSEKQVEAIAREIKDVAGENGLPLHKFEAWIQHVGCSLTSKTSSFTFSIAMTADYYNLEKLWADAHTLTWKSANDVRRVRLRLR